MESDGVLRSQGAVGWMIGIDNVTGGARTCCSAQAREPPPISMPIPSALGIWLDRGMSRNMTIRTVQLRRAIVDGIPGMISELDA
jgi:hypothetical protein